MGKQKGGQAEWFRPGVVIQTRAAELQQTAKNCQDDWFMHPDDLAKKTRYANALMDWAKETRNKKAKAHAQKLLDEVSANGK